jgi:hypothetical protein
VSLILNAYQVTVPLPGHGQRATGLQERGEFVAGAGLSVEQLEESQS